MTRGRTLARGAGLAHDAAVHVGLGCFTAGGGGARAHALQLARGLAACGLRVSLLCRAGDRDTHAALAATGLPVARVDTFVDGAAQVDALGLDVLQHFDSLLAAAIVESTRRPVASVQVLHAHPDPTFAAPPDDGVDVRVAVSASVARAYAGGGVPVVVIPNGVGLAPLPAPLPASPAVVWVGRLDRAAKDLDLLVAVEARRRGEAPLVIVGDGPDAAWLDAAWLDATRVERRGALTDPAAVRGALDAATVLLSTSAREGFGLAIAEALAAGRGVVARRAGGLTEALEGCAGARLVGPGLDDGAASTDTLADALAAALDALTGRDDAPRREAEASGAAARAFAERHLDDAKMTDAYVALYRDLLARRSRL